MRASPPPSSARRSRSARGSDGSMVGTRVSGWRSRLNRLRLLPVLQKFFEADRRQGVVEQLLDNRRRTGADVGAHARRLDDVDRVAAAGNEHFGRELVVVVDL